LRARLLAWLLALELIGLAAFPLLFHILPGLPDRGFALAKTLALLLVAYAAWLLGSFHLMAFTPASVWLCAGLLIAAGPGAVPEPETGARPYDVALLDLAGDPFQLGDLRRRGLVRAETAVTAFHLDDRIFSEQEMARRCLLWGVLLPDDGEHVGEPALAPAPPGRTLVLGGTRSGKSREAELRLAGEPDVTYLATAPAPDGTADPDWADRIAAHRERRPRGWTTAEGVDVAGHIRNKSSGILLVDGIGRWLAGVLDECGAWDQAPDGAAGLAAGSAAAKRVDAAMDELVLSWRQAPARIVAVSDEAGSGVVPATRAGRLFRDRLGQLNQRLAAESEEVVLVVAGRILTAAT
jgi:adenosylcobinamide kinase/adenosylcobinamide-phosphate guanylyltransferase